MKILIATHNPAKFERYRQLLKDIPGITLVSLTDLRITQKVDEPFSTARENAIHKAKFYASLSHLPTLAIDEATKTNFLPDNEQPGVFVRRFANTDKEMTDEEQLKYWKQIFDKYPEENKEFEWDFSIAYSTPDKHQLYIDQAIMLTSVAKNFSPTLVPGYPMSSFLIHKGTNKPHAELTEEEKLHADREIFQSFIKNFSNWIKS